MSSPTEIEVRAGDCLIWTTNSRQLGPANRSPAGVQKIDLEGITLEDSHATRTLAPDKPSHESSAYRLAPNMHRA